MNLSRAVFKILAANVGKAALSFLVVVVFARLLGATNLGIYFLFEAAVVLLMIPADPGISSALKKRLSEGTSLETGLTNAVALVVVPLGIFLALIAVFRAPFEAYLGARIAHWVAIGLTARIASRLILASIEGQLRVGEISELLFGQTLVWAIGSGIFLAMGGGVVPIIIFRIAGDGLIVAWGAWKLYSPQINLRSFQLSITTAKSLFNYSKFAFVSSLGGPTYGWMDVAILGLFVAQSSIGAYEVAWRVSMLPLLVGTSIARVIFPQISHWHANEGISRIEAMLPQAIVPAVAVTIPAFIGVFVIGEEVLQFVFGQEYTIATAALIILAGEKILQSVHALIGRSLLAIDRPEAAARATVYAVIVNVGLNLALIPLFGLAGAATATVASFGVNTLLHARYLNQSLTIRIPWRPIAWATVSALTMGTVLHFGIQILPVRGVYSLVTIIGAAAVIYIGILLLDESLRSMARNQLRAVLS